MIPRTVNPNTNLNGIGGDGFDEGGVNGAFNALAGFFRDDSFSVQFEELLNVILGHLEDLNLVDGNVLKGEDGRAGLFDFLTNGIGDELTDDILQFTAGDFTSNDFKHALTDGTDLGSLSVTGLLDLLRATLSESNAEETDEVTISSLDISVTLNQGLPLLDHGTELVLSQGHSVEISQTDLSLDFINTQTELAESGFFTLGVQVSQGHFQNTSLQAILSRTQTLSTVNKSLTNLTVGEHAWCLDIIPFLTSERINNLLLQSLLSL